MNKAIFLDRDGTINIDPGYLGDPNLVKLYSGVSKGIKKLKDEYGFLIIVISNQSGITRGLISANEVDLVNERINEILSENETKIDAFYYCPYHPKYDSKEKCKCRKPSPKMVFSAAKDHNIDLSRSFFVGDKVSDIECGKNANTKSILIKNTLSNSEIEELNNSENEPDYVSSNFIDIVKFVENTIK